VRRVYVQAAVRSGVRRVTGASWRRAWTSTTVVQACFHADVMNCSVLECVSRYAQCTASGSVDER